MQKFVKVAKPVGWDPVNQCAVIVAQQKKGKVYFKEALKRKVNL